MSNSAVSIASENVLSLLNLNKPQIDDEYFIRYEDEGHLYELLEMLGRVKGVEGTTFEHWENTYLNEPVYSGTTVSSSGAGTSVTVQLGTGSYMESGTLSAIQVNSIVLFKNGVVGQITAVNKSTPNAHTMTVVPLRAADDIGTVTAGDAILVDMSNAWADGTDQPQGRISNVIKVDQSLQIIKDQFSITGSEYGNAEWVPFTNSKGETGNYAIFREEGLTVKRFRGKKEFNMMIVPSADNTALTNNGIRTSNALIPSIKNGGGTYYPYSTTFTFEDYKRIFKKLDQGSSKSSEYLAKLGYDMYADVQSFTQDFMKNGAVSYGTFNGNQDLAINLNYSSIRDQGYTLHLSKYDLFNKANGLGAQGFNWPKNGVFIPMGATKDGKGNAVPYMRLRVKNGNGYDRANEVWVTGGAGNIKKTGTVDRIDFSYRSEVAPEWFGINNFVFVESV